MTGVNLGNLGKRMRLECSACGWIPPEDTTMEAVQLHCQVEHDTDQVRLNLAAGCRCGATMRVAGSATHGGRTMDSFRCEACGNTGYTDRKADP